MPFFRPSGSREMKHSIQKTADGMCDGVWSRLWVEKQGNNVKIKDNRKNGEGTGEGQQPVGVEEKKGGRMHRFQPSFALLN